MTIRLLGYCAALLCIVNTVTALDDLPIYYDAWEEDGTDCERTGVDAEWYIGFSSCEITTASVGNVKFLPLSCDDKYRGTDALNFEIRSPVQQGGYYDVIIKFGDHKPHGITGYKDLRFRVKNCNTTEEKLR